MPLVGIQESQQLWLIYSIQSSTQIMMVLTMMRTFVQIHPFQQKCMLMAAVKSNDAREVLLMQTKTESWMQMISANKHQSENQSMQMAAVIVNLIPMEMESQMRMIDALHSMMP